MVKSTSIIDILIAPFTLFSIRKAVMSVCNQIFHGYLTADGKRTRDKSGCLVYHSEKAQN